MKKKETERVLEKAVKQAERLIKIIIVLDKAKRGVASRKEETMLTKFIKI